MRLIQGDTGYAPVHCFIPFAAEKGRGILHLFNKAMGTINMCNICKSNAWGEMFTNIYLQFIGGNHGNVGYKEGIAVMQIIPMDATFIINGTSYYHWSRYRMLADCRVCMQ